MNQSRGNMIGFAVRLVAFVQAQQLEFSTLDFSLEMEIDRRSALRWLRSAEASGLVACRDDGRGLQWRGGDGAVAAVG